MTNSEAKNNRIQDLIKSKASLRKMQAKMSFEEKIRNLIELQKISREMRKDRNEKVHVWEID